MRNFVRFCVLALSLFVTAGAPLCAQQTQVIPTNASGFTYRGQWQASTSYHVNDIFTNNNSTYEVSTAFISGSSFDASKANVWVSIPTNLNATSLNVGSLAGTGSGSWFLQGPCLSSAPATPTSGPIIYCDATNNNLLTEKNTNGTVTVLGSGGGSSLTLSTTGSGGAATFSGGILNIPAMTSGNIIATLGFTPISSSASTVNFASGATVNIPGSGKYVGHQVVTDSILSGDSTTSIVTGGSGTVNVNATNFNWNSSPIATQAYVNSQVISGSGGTPYTTPTQNSLPLANISGGTLSFQNSAFSDDGNTTFDSEDLGLFGLLAMENSGTATSGQNFPSNSIYPIMSYWNGTAPIQTSWQIYAAVGTGTNPSTVLNFYTPADLLNASLVIGINPSILASAGTNFKSPKFSVRGACWNGTTSIFDDWSLQSVPGTGTNPVETLQFVHTGCSGATTLSVPGLTVTSGVPGINNGGAQWTGGTSLPSSCNIGDFFNLTNATSAANAMQVCYPANVWNPLNGSSGGGSTMTGTPTHIGDAGAGTGPTISFNSDATDGRGLVTLTEGSSPPTGSSLGIITVDFGGTYATVPYCFIEPGNPAASALSGTTKPFVSAAATTTGLFVINSGTTALTAGGVYVWVWSCRL